MSSWFVTPNIVRLALSDDQWLDVKQELTAGEERAMFAAMGEVNLGTRLAGSGIREQWIAAYVLAWSLTDDDGRPVAFSAGALDALRGDRLTELWEAVNAHDERVRTARETEKKNPRWQQSIASEFAVARVMHWSLAEVRALRPHEFGALVTWINES